MLAATLQSLSPSIAESQAIAARSCPMCRKSIGLHSMRELDACMVNAAAKGAARKAAAKAPRVVGSCDFDSSHRAALHEKRENCDDWQAYTGLVVCEHCPDHPHPLDDDGTVCKFPRKAVV